MKYKFFKLKIITIIIVFIAVGCDENKLEPIENNTTPPGTVSNVTVENLAGKAKITYALPKDQDLLYVKAEYTLASGKRMEIKSSYYSNSLVVEGFSKAEEQTVTLYAVNRSEVSSEPVEVKVNPLESPIWDVFRSLETKAAFGGIFLGAENMLRHELALLVMEKINLVSGL